MPPTVTAEPGRWRNERTPYLVEIMDAVTWPDVETIVFLKPTQVGFSEATRNELGYWIDVDPGPCLIVMPSEQAAKEIFEERLKPLLLETPALRRHVSKRADDMKVTAIKLATMSVYAGWAGSPQALASRPIRYLILDEVDKYPLFSGREADPISLGYKRLSTYGHRARVLIGSTPTTRYGQIWKWWESCGLQLHYVVPCPHCGEFQRLIFDQIKWPDIEPHDRLARAERIELENLAHYECEHCGGIIRDGHKPRMLTGGVWLAPDQSISKGGKVSGKRPKAKRVGFHINAIYSPWVAFSKLAAEFLRAVDDDALLMDFRNSRLAEPFEVRASSTKTDVILEKRKHAGPPMIVPAWAHKVFAAADVQKDHIYYTVAAWGHAFRSQRITYGIVSTFDELAGRVLGATWAREDGRDPPFITMALAIDQKYRTDEVFSFAETDPGRIWPVAGSSRITAEPFRTSNVKAYEGVVRRTVNPIYWKDVLHGYIHADDVTLWLPHCETGEDYAKSMASEHKILDPQSQAFRWVPVSAGAPNHWWDCEYHLCWMARELGVASIPSPEQLAALEAAERQEQASEGESGRGTDNRSSDGQWLDGPRY